MRGWNPWLVGCLAVLVLLVVLFLGGAALFFTVRSSSGPAVVTQVAVPIVQPSVIATAPATATP